MFLFLHIKHKPPVNDPADAMINRWLCQRILPRDDPSFAVAHAHENQVTPIISKVQVLILLKVRRIKMGLFKMAP
jgi:hypothetical protein